MRASCVVLMIFFFKQKTAYEMRISDWSSDVCSSDLAFVSKAEVGTTPLVGWLADQNRTIYVPREAKREIHNQANELRGALARGRPVTLFPEGTTGPGDGLLPFRASLLTSVLPTPPRLRVPHVPPDSAQSYRRRRGGNGGGST